MSRIILIYFALAFIAAISSCTPKPAIQINDTLEIGLGKKYSAYVVNLNASVKGDTSALYNFLNVKDLYDGAVYEHGWVLIELMRKLGDETFANALGKLNKQQMENLNIYFKGGLDMHSKASELPRDYPNSFIILGYQNEL
jgi:hypothetical protein